MNNKIVIVVEGGVVQHVLLNSPTEIMVLDHDTDGVEESDLSTFKEIDGQEFKCQWFEPSKEVHKEAVDNFFKQRI